MLLHITPKVAAKRACAATVISISSLKVVTRFYADEELKKRFWEVMETFSNEDRSLFVKFITGRQRLAQGDRMEVHGGEKSDDRLPTAGTCSNYMNLP